MSKRIVAVLLSVLLTVPVLPVALASQAVNYTVSVYAASGPNQFISASFPSGTGNYSIYTAQGTYADYFGYFITIPPSSDSGYLVVSGYHLALGALASGSSIASFQASTTYMFNTYLAESYVIYNTPPSLKNVPSPNDGTSFSGEAFTGMVYIPAHSDYLYLVVYPSYFAHKNQCGVARSPSSLISFIPESSDSDAFDSVIQELESIRETITSTPEQNQESQAFVDQIDQILEKIDELTQQIDDNTNRPDPDDLLPSAPAELLPPSDDAAAAGYDAVSSILASPLMLSLLVMVFTLAFVRYVLFGKHDG